MTTNQIPVPEAEVKARFDEHMQTVGPTQGNWQYSILKTCEELGIPIMKSLMGDTPAPGLREQLLGKQIDTMLIPVTWEESKCIACCIGTNEPAGTIIEDWTIRRGLPLKLIAAEHIVLE